MPRPTSFGRSTQQLLELSLRHLPDLSDSSFQMSVSGDTGELLLADESDKFFEDIDDGFDSPPREPTSFPLVDATPVQSRSHEPLKSAVLTLNELTPKPKSKPKLKAIEEPVLSSLSEASSLPPTRKQETMTDRVAHPLVLALRQKLKDPIGRKDERKARADNIATGLAQNINSGLNAAHKGTGSDRGSTSSGLSTEHVYVVIEPRQERECEAPERMKGKARTHQTSSEAAIANRTTYKLPPRTSPPPRTDTGERSLGKEISPPTDLDQTSPAVYGPRADVSMNIEGGAAQRLLVYGQMLLNSIELLPPTSSSLSDGDKHNLHGTRNGPRTPPTHPAEDLPEPLPNRSDEPLTLSQISPQKPTATEGDLEPAPQLVPNKRPASTEPSSKRAKKGKPTVTTSARSLSRINAKTLPAKALASSRQTTRSNQRVGSNKPKHGKAGHNGSVICADSVSSSITGGSTSTQESSRAKANSGRQGQAAASLERQINLQASALAPTKPIGFNFHVDARLEARSEKMSASTMKRSTELAASHLVPDFKGMHAAQEAALANRKKENIAPVLPLPLELNTDIRAREREKFDQMVRAKEMEVARQIEERRLRKEMEEEDEIRVLRKKAVPKAHEVPEWYVHAPKRRVP